jgi:hypothetical protein
MKTIKEQVTVFSVGAISYSLIELLWRQHTHWSMSLTGGTCFTLLYNIYNYAQSMPLLSKCAIGSGIITIIEFLVGVVVNIWQKWNVWDYSEMKFNLLGQICLLYSFLWFLLSVPISFLSTGLKKRLERYP